MTKETFIKEAQAKLEAKAKDCQEIALGRHCTYEQATRYLAMRRTLLWAMEIIEGEEHDINM